MKKFFFVLFLAFMAVSAANGQTIQPTKDGNFVAVKPAKDTATYTATGRTYTDKAGKVWPVYKSKSGRLWALVTSKTGKKYRVYMPK